MKSNRDQTGFTIIELVMVIAIMGVIGAMVAVFMKGPIDSYLAQTRRAAMTDTADTAMRRVARDIHIALPNSIRTSGSSCIEMIPTKSGGRYRGDDAGALLFNTQVTSFNMLGDTSLMPSSQQPAAGDLIVIYNLGMAGADAYAADNYAAITSIGPVSAGETTINISSKQFPLPSGSRRFHVVPASEMMISYVCTGSDLHRTASTVLTTTASCPSTGPIIASNVDCTGTAFNYTGSDLQRNGQVHISLKILDDTGTESVTLEQESHVSNTP